MIPDDIAAKNRLRDFQPAGAAEIDHVVEMVYAKWQQRRIAQVQSDLYDDAILSAKQDLEERFDEFGQVQELAENGLLDKLRRTEAHPQRAYTRARASARRTISGASAAIPRVARASDPLASRGAQVENSRPARPSKETSPPPP